jgi:hypothetical protein
MIRSVLPSSPKPLEDSTLVNSSHLADRCKRPKASKSGNSQSLISTRLFLRSKQTMKIVPAKATMTVMRDERTRCQGECSCDD